MGNGSHGGPGQGKYRETNHVQTRLLPCYSRSRSCNKETTEKHPLVENTQSFLRSWDLGSLSVILHHVQETAYRVGHWNRRANRDRTPPTRRFPPPKSVIVRLSSLLGGSMHCENGRVVGVVTWSKCFTAGYIWRSPGHVRQSIGLAVRHHLVHLLSPLGELPMVGGTNLPRISVWWCPL